MQIFITGASGFIGQYLFRALLTEGHQVVACVRQPELWQARFPEVTWISGDYTTDHSPQVWLPRLTNIEVVINAVGIIREQGRQSFAALHTHAPVALFRAAEQAGIRKILQISALGADETAQSKYHLTKRAADDILLTLNVDAVIFYPSIVIGRGGGSTTLFAALAALPWLPVIGQGEQCLQPIHIDDLTAGVLALLRQWPSGSVQLPLVGANAVTFLQFLVSLRHWLNLPNDSKKVPLLPIPISSMKRLARVNDILGIGPLTTETLGMLLRGNCGDPVPFTTLTGIQPRTLQASLRENVATLADRWQARLWFLRPLLRISIGLLWLFTGIASVFLYPRADSYALLAATGISGLWAPLMLYTAATLDGILGIATLLNRQIQRVVGLQLFLMVSYTAIITWFLPSLWLHPFGPITKNLPLLVATLIMLVLEEE